MIARAIANAKVYNINSSKDSIQPVVWRTNLFYGTNEDQPSSPVNMHDWRETSLAIILRESYLGWGYTKKIKKENIAI